MKKQELETQIEELETALLQLKTKLRAIEQQEQHDAIDNLDTYLQSMDHKWENIRNFWPIVLEELRDIFSKREQGKD